MTPKMIESVYRHVLSAFLPSANVTSKLTFSPAGSVPIAMEFQVVQPTQEKESQIAQFAATSTLNELHDDSVHWEGWHAVSTGDTYVFSNDPSLSRNILERLNPQPLNYTLINDY